MVVEFVKRFKKELKNTPIDVQKRVLGVIEKLETAQTLEASGTDYKKMEGQKSDESYFRIRVGEWRIGIEYLHPNIILLRLLSRGDIYKHFPPR